MPTYRITDPDGVEWEIDGPAGASRSEIAQAVMGTKEYKNASFVRKQMKNKDQIPESLPESAATNATETTRFLKGIPQPKKEVSLGQAFELGRLSTKHSFENEGGSMKHSGRTPEERALYREAQADRQARELQAAGLGDINWDDLPIEKKLVASLPGLGAVLGGAATGAVVGGPVGAVVGGGTTAMMLAGGGATKERAALEKQGVDPKAAKQVADVDTFVRPGMQIGSVATMGPGGAAVGFPAADVAATELKNKIMRGVIHGPESPEHPIRPFSNTGDDLLLSSLFGAASNPGRPTSPMAMGPRPQLPPPTLRLGGPEAPPPTGPRPGLPGPDMPPAAGPRPAPPTPPSSGGGGSVITPPKTPSVRDINRAKLMEKISRDLDEANFQRMNRVDDILAPTRAPTVTETPVRPVTPKTETNTTTRTEVRPVIALPPVAGNPIEAPPTQVNPLVGALQDATRAAGDVDAWSIAESASTPPDRRAEAQTLLSNIDTSFDALANETRRIISDLQRTGSDYVEELANRQSTIEDPEGVLPDMREEALISLYNDAVQFQREFNDRQGSLFGGEASQPTPSDGPPEIPGYADSFGSTTPPKTAAPLDAKDKTATDPEVRQAMADYEPIETLPPKQRVQEGGGISRKQVADANALVRKLVYAGYKEVEPGVWKHESKLPKGKQKGDRPDWGKSVLERKAPNVMPDDDVREGNAVTQKYYDFDDDVEAIERVWVQDNGGYIPWEFAKSRDPYRGTPKSPFKISSYYLKPQANEEELTPQDVLEALINYVPWFPSMDTTAVFWADIQNLAPLFLAHGYDALTFVDLDMPRLFSFEPTTMRRVSMAEAKNIHGQKTSEYARQLKDALWMRPDRTMAQQQQDLQNIQKLIDSGTDIQNVLTYLSNAAPSKGMRALASQIQGALERYEEAGVITSIRVLARYVDTEGVPKENIAGNYKLDGSRGEVTLYFKSNGMSFRTILHELIHAVTIPVTIAMTSFKEYVDEHGGRPEDHEMLNRFADMKTKIQEFYAYAQRAMGALELDEDDARHNVFVKRLMYNKSAWSENVHEFLAYALTEDPFQRLLHNIPVKEGNGLWMTTEEVRKFHGIEENMNTLFFEAVKMFNEFANFNMAAIPNLVEALEKYNLRSTTYFAKVDIRGPPDYNRALITFLDDYGIVQTMSGGGLPIRFTKGRSQLEPTVTRKQYDIFPMHDGNELFQFIQNGRPTPAPMADAPMYVVGIPQSKFRNMTSTKQGVVHNGVHYFVVDNTEYAPLILPMRRLLPESFLDLREALYLIRNGIDLPSAIKPYLETDRTRARLAMLPKAVRSSMPQDLVRKLENSSEFIDLTIDEAKALWEALPADKQDLPKIYEYTSQLVSGAESVAVLTNHPLIRWARGAISADIGEQSETSKHIIGQLGDAFLALSDQERVGISDFLIQMDRAEVAFDEAQLTRLGFTPNQVRYAMTIREADDYHYNLWNEKRALLGLPPVPYRKGHIPSIFEGDYRALVHDIDPVTGEKKIIGFLGANSQPSFKARKKFLERKYPGITFKDLPKKRFDGAPLNGNLFDIYTELASQLSPNDPNMQNIKNVLQEFAKFDESRYLGFHVHEMAKQGIWGGSGDRPWRTKLQNANDLYDSLVRYFQEGSAHHHMLEFMQDMDRVFLDPDINEKAPRAVKYLRELYNHVLRHPPKVQGDYTKVGTLVKEIGRMSDKGLEIIAQTSDLTGLGFGPKAIHAASGTVRYAFATWAMGLGNLAFTFLQLMQVPMYAPQMTMILRKQLGMNFIEGRADAAKAATGLAKYIIHHLTKGKSAAMFGPLDRDLETNTALTYAEDNNLINFTDIDRALEHVLSPTVSKVDRVLNFNQRYAEALTRPLVFLWFFHLSRTAGLPMKEALESARHRVQFVMVPYDLRDRPMLYASLGAAGMAFGQLKTFAHANVQISWYYTKQMKKGQFKPFIYGLSMALFVHGQLGLIGMQDADNLVRAVNQQVNKENYGIKELAYQYLPDLITRGPLSVWTGIDFHSRLRSVAFIQWPVINSVLPSAANWLVDQAKNVGRLYDAASKVEAGKRAQSSEVQKAISGFTPPAAKPFAEKALGNKSLNDRTGPLRGYERDDFDWTVRYFGMRSLKESKATESIYDAKGDNAMRSMDLKEIELELREAFRKGYYDKEYVTALQKEYLVKGGSPKNLVTMMKGLPPQTVEQDMLGKPSKGNATRLIDKFKNMQERKQQ